MRHRSWGYYLSLGFLVPALSGTAMAAITAVWANDGGDKVTQEDLRVSLKSQNVMNSVWDGTTIKVFGAHNEIVNFNVVLEAPNGAGPVSVSLSPLSGPHGSVIDSARATGDQVFNFIHRNIELFYVRYLPIRGLSLVSYGTYDERHVPRRLQRPWSGNGFGSGTWRDRPDHDNHYPDIAVPLELVPTFSIAASRNQSIWVDIYIPKDIPSGLYRGNFLVRENNVPTHKIPVQMKVYNFTLPDTPSAKTMLYASSSNINRRILGSSYIQSGSTAGFRARLVRDRYFLLAHRHKISLIGDNPDDCDNTRDQPCPEWLPRLDGSLFTAAHGYDGPGVHTGNNIYAIGCYGTWKWKTGDQVSMTRHADAWASWFKQNAPDTDYFLYLADESSDTLQTESWARWILNDSGQGQQLKSMATITLPIAAIQCPSLDIPASTIWVGLSEEWESLAERYTHDRRKRFYVYNGHRPACGSFAIEDDGVALRELAWVQYKKQINRWFYWESTYYNNYQGGQGETDIFKSAQTFGAKTSTDPVLGETGWNYGNGDGILFYPGTDMVYKASSYGVEGPFASLRLKEWRRGLQDVDYLTMASAVNPRTVQALVNRMVPKALWEYGVSDPHDPTWVRSDISWSTEPDHWEAARQQLAQLLEGAAKTSL